MSGDPRDLHLGELAAACALDAVDADERPRVDAHLAACPDCRAEVDRLTETVTGLAYARPPLEPPAELRARVLAGLTDVAAAPAPAGKERRRLRRPRLVLALAAAVVLLAVGGLVAHERGGGVAPAPPQTVALGRFGSATVAGDGQLVLDTAAVQPPPGRVYEAWLISDGHAKPAGILTPGQAQRIPTSLVVNSGDTIAVTSEPAQGAHLQPTTAPIVARTV
ncbi:MAG TPA: anti-sigma factor [Gaiellales bacterium]|jgi:anti-sigma-K factor RskA|nr:anti-sigma factor [Gaiellales bacterium]